MGIQFGFDHSAANQFRALVQAREDVELLLLRDTALEAMPEIEVLTLPAAVKRLPWFIRSLWRFGQAFQAVRRRKIDFVHGVHLWPAGMVGWAAARLTGRSSGVTIVAGSRELGYLGKIVGRAALHVLRKSDIVVVTGDKTRRDLEEWGIDPAQIRVIPNVTDVSVYHPDPSVAKKYDIVSTNRMFWVKNLGTLLRAVAILRKDHPDLTVALGGTGPEEEKLKALARELGAPFCFEDSSRDRSIFPTLDAAAQELGLSRSSRCL